jgi:transposase InsO family protein
LLQESDGIRRPIWFASRILKPAETRYSVSEKECLAVLWAIEKFRGFIECSHFIIETDHQALTWLTRLKEPTGRLARWFMVLQMYDFEIRYKPGDSPQIRGADALSRIPANFMIEYGNEIDRQEMISSQNADPYLKEIIEHKLNDNSNSPRVKRQAERSSLTEDGLLMKYVGPKEKPWSDDALHWRVWIPSNMYRRVMHIFHSDLLAGHLGIRKTFHRLEQRVYWKSLRKDVVRFIKECIPCQKAKLPYIPPAPASSFSSEIPWDVVAVDLMGPYPRGTNQHTYMLVVVDVFSRYVELFPIRNSTAKTIIDKLWLVCCRWGIMKTILQDNGPCFTAKLYFEWCARLGIKTFHISAYHPQSNMTERYVQTVKKMIVSCIDTCSQWDKYIPEISFALRTARNDSTQFTPAYLNTGRELRTPFDNRMQLTLSTFKEIKDLGKRIEIIYSLARENSASAKESSLIKYNSKSKSRSFDIGDQVWLKTHFLSDQSKGFSAKLAPKREGPYKITAIVATNIYNLESIETGQKVFKVHINELTPYFAFQQNVESSQTEADHAISSEIPGRLSSPPTSAIVLSSDVSLSRSLSGVELSQPNSSTAIEKVGDEVGKDPTEDSKV